MPCAETVPGPGQYGCIKSIAREASAAQAAFRSTSERDQDPALAEAARKPGPGEYQAQSAIKVAATEPCGGSSFKHPSRLRIARVHRDLPAASGEAREVLGSFGEEVSRECQGTEFANRKLPGPGHYEQDRDVIWKGNLVGMSGHSGFIPGSKRTDFAREDLSLLPGPGRYNPQRLDGGLNLASAVSAFQSGTERIRDNATDAPGPAYYSAKMQQEHMSFRMRSGARQWLPG